MGTVAAIAANLKPSSGPRLMDGEVIQKIMAYLNLAATQYNKNTAGVGTAAAGEVTGARFVSLELENDTAYAYTTRTVAEMVADLGEAFFVGMSYMLLISNTGSGTVTLTAGTGVTLAETATIATLKARLFHVNFSSATACTITSVGVMDIES